MTIRRTLLWAFLMVGVTPVLVLAFLAFDRASGVLQREIEQGLAAQAAAALSNVDKLMFERLQNATTWARLEVMHDLQVGDVDKRVSTSLQALASGYGGLYHELLVVDRQGRVMASSVASSIGGLPLEAIPWQGLVWAGSRVALDLPQQRLEGSASSPVTTMTLRVAVPAAFAQVPLGELRLRLDWGQIDRMLSQAAGDDRLVALLDKHGRVVAGSAALLSLWPRLSMAPAALPDPSGSLQTGDGRTLLAGLGQTRGFAGFEGLGWRVLVLVPRAQALAPVRQLAWGLAVLLGLVLMLTVLASRQVSRAIAQPIVALTAFSRQHGPGLSPMPQQAPGRSITEVSELQRAFVQMVQDIEQGQQQLARASALAAVGEMSAVIAHEVRTPLGIMLSSAQVLQRESGLSSEGRELASFIESETARLGRLVSTMLESTRPRPPHCLPTPLPALIDHAVALLSSQASKKGVQVDTTQAQAPVAVECDAEQMTQVLLNLVLNALQILQHGGRVEIATQVSDDKVKILISDNGPGIAPDARARLFEAFYFRREGGIGLGLAVVQSVVHAHLGQVEVDDSALGGALFRVLLPLRQPGADAAPPLTA